MWSVAARISAGPPRRVWRRPASAACCRPTTTIRRCCAPRWCWAAAARVTGRGAIEEGLRAGLVVVDPAVPRVIATVVGGRIAYLTAEGAGRLSAVRAD